MNDILRDAAVVLVVRASSSVADPVCSAALSANGLHVVSVNVDAAPLLTTFMVDGILCDGGAVWECVSFCDVDVVVVTVSAEAPAMCSLELLPKGGQARWPACPW
jgi:hypothetical protein